MRTFLLALVVTAAPAVHGLPSATPAVETPALFDDKAGGNANADDPAIWVAKDSGKAW